MFSLDELPDCAAAPGNKRNLSLKIFALGRFSVVRDSEPIRFARKAQSRPLQLLKTLIALGGREIAMARLAATLWPDAEGDAAHKAFEIALHRLRRLIGVDKALVLHDGLLGLDNQYCWVDVWAFEQATSQTEALLKSPNKDTDELAHLCANVMALYHGLAGVTRQQRTEPARSFVSPLAFHCSNGKRLCVGATAQIIYFHRPIRVNYGAHVMHGPHARRSLSPRRGHAAECRD